MNYVRCIQFDLLIALLGILLTGPLGFVLGALIGGIRQPKSPTS